MRFLKTIGKALGAIPLLGLLVLFSAASVCSMGLYALLGLNRTLRTLLLASFLPAFAWAGTQVVNTPSTITAIPGATELIANRTAFGKDFYLGNGKGVLVLSTEPVHYRDALGFYQNVGTAVKDTVDGIYRHIIRPSAKFWFEFDDSARFRYVAKRGSIAFTPRFSLANIDVAFAFGHNGMKASYTLKNPSAPDSLVWNWLVTPDTSVWHGTLTNAIIKAWMDPKLPYPTAWDATGDTLHVERTATGSTMSYKVNTVGAVYPITVDPTIVDTTDTGGASGYGMAEVGASWFVKRDSVAAFPQNDSYIVGSNISHNYRSYLSFPLASYGTATTVDSVRLFWTNGGGGGWPNDSVWVYPVMGNFTGAVVAANWYNDFYGWNSGNAPVAGKGTSVHTPQYLTAAAVKVVATDGVVSVLFSAAGQDSVKNHVGIDTLRIVLLSDHDLNRVDPGGIAKHGYYSYPMTTYPTYIKIYYNSVAATPAAVITLKDADTLKVTGARISATLGGKAASLGNAGFDSVGFPYYKRGAAVGTALFTVLDSASASITWHVTQPVDSFFVTTKAADSLTIDTFYVVTAFCATTGGRVFSTIDDTISTYGLNAVTAVTGPDSITYVIVRFAGIITAPGTNPVLTRGIEYWPKGAAADTDTAWSAGGPFAAGLFYVTPSLAPDTLVFYRVILTTVAGTFVSDTDSVLTTGSATLGAVDTVLVPVAGAAISATRRPARFSGKGSR